jgi:Tfp pilus assembly protein PilO
VSPRLRRRLLIVTAVVAGLNAVVYGAYTLPRSLQERYLATRRATLREEVERERQVVAGLQSQAEAARTNVQDVRRFYDTILGVRTESQVPVLREIESLARAGGLRPGAASYNTEPIKGGGLERFGITQPVDGTYRELISFIEHLEQSKRFYTLDQVKVAGSGRDSNRVQLDLALTSYFRLPGRAAEARK